MEISEYQERAFSTCTPSSNNDSYMLLGLVAEVGELADKVAKGIRKETMRMSENKLYLHCDESAELDIEMRKELGDILWFVAGVASARGWKLEDIADANLKKLADRQKRGVIIGSGDNR